MKVEWRGVAAGPCLLPRGWGVDQVAVPGTCMEYSGRQDPLVSGLPGGQVGQLFQFLFHMLLQLTGPQQDLADGANRGLAVKQCCGLFLTW